MANKVVKMCHIVSHLVIYLFFFPLYLTCLVYDYVPGRSLRSNQSNLLTVPSCKLNFGTRSFRVAAPTT